jgi:hypothetical protein
MNETRPRPGEPRHEALGDVARDVMDHVSMIARDESKMARLAVRRYVEHLRAEVAPRALFRAGVGACVALAGVFFLIALFLGIAWAIGSVAWTFLIFAALFGAGAVLLAAFAGRPARLESGEAIARRFPAARTDEGRPSQALVRQTSPEGHRAVVAEAQREALHEGERRVERWEIAPRHDGQSLPIQPPPR